MPQARCGAEFPSVIIVARLIESRTGSTDSEVIERDLAGWQCAGLWRAVGSAIERGRQVPLYENPVSQCRAWLYPCTPDV